eukprot:gene5401-5416_t
MSAEGFRVHIRKFMNNPLLNRKQFVIDISHPSMFPTHYNHLLHACPRLPHACPTPAPHTPHLSGPRLAASNSHWCTRPVHTPYALAPMAHATPCQPGHRTPARLCPLAHLIYELQPPRDGAYTGRRAPIQSRTPPLPNCAQPDGQGVRQG